MKSPPYRFSSLAIAAWLSLTVMAGDWTARGDTPAAPQLQQQTQPRRDGEGLIPPSDPDAESWLKRAADAQADGQWKLAVDTLARVIEQYPDRTVSPDGSTFISAATAAQHQISKWPPEGLATYRLLFDPVVNQLLTRARATADIDALRMIARDYRMATSAPQALSLLATLLMDRHEPNEALDVLDQLQHLPHNDVPLWQVNMQLAVACEMAGLRTEADAAIAALRNVATTQPDLLPADFSSRVEAVVRFAESSRSKTVSPSSADRASPEAELAPAVTPEVLWQEALPGSSRLDANAITHLITRTGRPPVWQAVTDGTALFVTCPEGLMARDLASIELLWKAYPRLANRDPRIDVQRRFARTYESDNSSRLDELSTRSIYHEYRGAVTTGLGLVYVIEQGGTMNELYPSRDGAVPPNDAIEPEPNSIRAFEARSGRVKWTIGRGGKPGDELRFVHFYSPPVPVGDRLIAPYQNQNDLYLAVFDIDGNLLRKVLLGSADKAMFPVNVVLTPTVDETTIYIPTAAGLLVALNRHDFSLRWLAMYDRSRGAELGPARRAMPLGSVQTLYFQPDEWLSSSPLRAGNLVLVAPQDGNHLLAFDRRDGSLKWSFPRGDHRYIVGATQSNVIVAGANLLAIDLDSGRGTWSYSKRKLTGRPVLNGRRVFVPTQQGLETIDAGDGTVIETTKPSAGPLGNLFVMDGALFSIGTRQFAKYPDIARSRAAALAQIEKAPQDPTAHIRLAWLAKLDNDWSAAMEHLDRAEARLPERKQPGASTDGELRARVAHQRVEVLLHLAEEAPPAQAKEFVDRAVQAALLRGDALLAGLAQCDLLVDSGSVAEAFSRALNLLAIAGEESVASSADLRVRASVALSERLQRWWNAADAPARAKMETVIREGFDAAFSASQTEICRVIADACSFAPAAAGMDLALAQRDWSEASLENAVFHLERAARRAVDEPTSLASLVLLLRAYADPGEGLPRSAADARRIHGLLQKRHGKAVVPGSLTGLPESFRGKSMAQLGAVCPADWRIESPLSPEPRILTLQPFLQLAGFEVVSASHPSDVSAFFNPLVAHDPLADMLPVRIMRQVRGVDVRADSNSEVFWACNLEPTLESADSMLSSQRVISLRPSDGAVSGRIALLQSDRQVSAIGLLSGQAAWPPVPVEADPADLPRPALIEHDGVFVFATQADVLTAAPARMNAPPLWRRTFPDHRLGTLNVINDQLVVVDRRATTVFVIDLASGRTRRQFSLVPTPTQPPEGAEETDEEDTLRDNAALASITGSVICNAAFKKIIGRDIATGRILWERSVNGRAKRLMSLGDGILGVCYRGQRIAVIRAQSGEVIADLEVAGMILPPSDAVVDGLTQGGATLPGGARLTLVTHTDDDPPDYVVASYSLESKSLLWKRNLGRFAIISPRMLRSSAQYLPIIEYRIRPDAPRQLVDQSGSHLDVAAFDVFDKAGGKSLLASPFIFDRDRASNEFPRSRLFTDLLVMNDRIVVISTEGYYVLQEAAGPLQNPAPDENRRQESPMP